MKKLSFIEKIFIKISDFKEKSLIKNCDKYLNKNDSEGRALFSKSYDKLKKLQEKQADDIEIAFLESLSMPIDGGKKAIERADAVIAKYDAKDCNMKFKENDIVSFDLVDFTITGKVITLETYLEKRGFKYPTDLEGVLVEVMSWDPVATIPGVYVGTIVEVGDKLKLVKKNSENNND